MTTRSLRVSRWRCAPSADPDEPLRLARRLHAQTEKLQWLAVVALVGVLNFANAMLTSILSRRREFAVLQAVGMTDAQLNGMLIAEGLLYAALAGGLSLVLCLLGGAAVETLAGGALWFFTYRFSLLPLGVTLPFFAALGAALPPIALHAARKQTLVERLRVE